MAAATAVDSPEVEAASEGASETARAGTAVAVASDVVSEAVRAGTAVEVEMSGSAPARDSLVKEEMTGTSGPPASLAEWPKPSISWEPGLSPA